MFQMSSLLVILCALCTHAQLVEDLIRKQSLPFNGHDDYRRYHVLYYKSGDFIDLSCKSNTTKDTPVFWEISAIRKTEERCYAGTGAGTGGGADYGPIRFRSRLRAADSGAYLACVAPSHHTVRKIYFIEIQDEDAEMSCREMSELFCPVYPTTADQSGSIAVAVNGKKLTAVNRNSSGLFDYTYYYNSSDRLQIDCSTVNTKAQYVSICGEAVPDVYAKCSSSETCTKTQTIRPKAGHSDQVLYCYTLLLDNITQSVARLTLVYNNSNTGSDKMATSVATSTYERVIPLPTKKPNNEGVRGNETVVSKTAVTSAADAASGSGLNSYVIYVLIAVSVLLIIIAVITTTYIVYPRKKGKLDITPGVPDLLVPEEYAGGCFVENELYTPTDNEYAVPCAPAHSPNYYQESAYSYVDPNSVKQYSNIFNGVYINSAVYNRGNAA